MYLLTHVADDIALSVSGLWWPVCRPSDLKMVYSATSQCTRIATNRHGTLRSVNSTESGWSIWWPLDPYRLVRVNEVKLVVSFNRLYVAKSNLRGVWMVMQFCGWGQATRKLHGFGWSSQWVWGVLFLGQHKTADSFRSYSAGRLKRCKQEGLFNDRIRRWQASQDDDKKCGPINVGLYSLNLCTAQLHNCYPLVPVLFQDKPR